MLRHLLPAVVLVVATSATAAPVAGAAPATSQCSSGVKVSAADSPATISVTDTRTDTSVDVVVTVTGTTFAITAPTDADYVLATASWCAKSSVKRTDPSPGTGLTGTSPSTNKKGVTQALGYVTVYSVTTAAPLGPCYQGDSRWEDFRLTGDLGTPDSGTFYTSYDGTCSGDVFYQRPVVSGADFDAATDGCFWLPDAQEVEFHLNDHYSGLPGSWWTCTPFED